MENIMKVTFLKDYGKNVAGDTLEIKDTENAQSLIKSGIIEEVKELELEDVVELVLEKTAKTPIQEKGITHIIKNEDGNFENFGDFMSTVYKSGLGDRHAENRLSKAAAGNNETTAADGGVLVPTDYSTDLWEKINAYGNISSRCHKFITKSNVLKIPAVTDNSRASTSGSFTGPGGVVVYDLGEGGAITLSKPQFEAVTLTLQKKAAIVVATEELLEDSMISIQNQFTSDVVKTIAGTMDNQVMVGAGGSQFDGILAGASSGACTFVNRETTGSVTVNDIANMYSRLHPDSRSRGVWLVNATVLPKLMALNNTYTAVWMPSFVPGIPGKLLGLDVIVTEFAKTLGTAGDILLMDFNAYAIAMKGTGIRQDASIHTYFSTDDVAFRFILRCDGAPLWTDEYTPLNGDTQSAYVILKATTS